jgi:hypothetical protein
MLVDPNDPAHAAGKSDAPSEHASRTRGAEASVGTSVPAPARAVAEGAGGAVLDELKVHPRGDDLARLVHMIAFAAADERRSSLSDGLAEAAERAGLSYEDGETRFGNVLRALERGSSEGAGSATRALLSGALARGIALSPPAGADAEERVIESLVWLAANTPVDALTSIDAALGQGAQGFWIAAGTIVRRVDSGRAPFIGRAGALIAAAGLAASTSPAARTEAAALSNEVRDPIVRALLGGPRISGATPLALEGELVPVPRSPAMLVLLGMTGILALMHVGRLLARWVLRYRKSAELRVSPRGVTVLSRSEMLGRTLREREVHIPIEGLLRAQREIRYPRLAMYVGLIALALGSYFGVSLLVDGARAGSPELLGIGALLVFVGVGLDYALLNAVPGARGRCRVVLVPRSGPPLAVGDLDPARADAALALLKG